MTIKEVEQLLEVPRATVRYYEKEGLIHPMREDNGYRDYSEVEVERLKQIIIFRKIGLSLADIEDVFDGAKDLSSVLMENIDHLKKQMDELQGAMDVCQKMCKEQVELDSFNAEKYWNIIDEEEKSGYKFIDIAKDIAKMEKGVLYEWVAWTNSVDEVYGSPKEIVRNVLIGILICGCIFCLMRGGWNVHNFLDGVLGVGLIMVVDMIIRIPLYFLGKRFEWVKTHRKAALYISCAILILALLVLENMR